MSKPDKPVTDGSGNPLSAAMLLAAGRGERMRPLTDTTAKPLLKVNGKRLIDYHLEKLASAGVQRVVVNTCWQSEKIVSTLGNGSAYGLDIEYSPESTALETAGGIRKALNMLGEDPFLVVSADVWSDINYVDFLSITANLNDLSLMAHLLMVCNPPHHVDGDFSIDEHNRLCPKIDPDTITRTTSSYTYSGIGLFRPEMFKELTVEPVPLREVLIPAIDAGQVGATIHSGKWFDVGTVDRLNALDTFLKKQV